MYGSAAAFGMFESRLKQYFNFMEHLDECFKGFKEVGNVVALVSMFEGAISVKQVRAATGETRGARNDKKVTLTRRRARSTSTARPSSAYPAA
jgi:hypothetical protein